MAVNKVVMHDPRKTDRLYEEAIKTLRANLQFSGRGIRSIVLTSCFPNEGKSDVSFQLARELGKMGKKVLLLDADIRKSSFANRYDIGVSVKGLSHFLSGQVQVDDIIYKTNFENLDIIFAGALVPNPSELLEDAAMGELVKYYRAIYDYVLIDTPPIAGMADAMIVAKWCDGAILVIEKERVSYRMAQKAKAQLEQTGCRMLGAVLNKVDTKHDRYYGKYGYYNYSSYYGKEK